MKNVWLAILLVLLFSGGVFAQSMGTINGRVTDPAGAVVPGATVTAINPSTGAVRTTATSGDGSFVMSELMAGTYNVSVEKAGFAKAVKDGGTLVTGMTLTLNFSLGLAGTAQQVEVTSEAPMVEVTQSVVSGALQTSEVQSLPILNRNFASLVALIPGARPTATAGQTKVAQGAGIGFGGSAGRSGGAEVDGGFFRDDGNGGSLFNVSLESVQEFSVLSHDYGAQYGMTSGGVILITTKSGTNQLHGSAFAFGRNQDMTGIDYFSNPANGGVGKPPYDREQFGGSLGFPIVKDKLFFFAAAERLSQDSSQMWPTASYQQAQLLKTNLMSLTSCASCVLVGNMITPSPYAPVQLRTLMVSTRMDYQINSRNSLFFRWARERTNNYDDILQANNTQPPHPDIDPNGSNVNDHTPGDSGILSETWVVSNNSVNTIGVEANHYLSFQTCHCTLFGAGANFIWRNMQFPSLMVGVTTGVGDSEYFVSAFQFKDTFAHQAGNHALKIGGDFIYYPRNGNWQGGGGGSNEGSMTTFDDPATIIGNTNGKYPKGFLTPGIIKQMIVGSVTYGGPAGFGAVVGAKEFSGFLQDDWKIKPRLTLNLGMRYSIDLNFKGESDPGAGQNDSRALLALEAIHSPYGAQIHTPEHDFSPRVGFAWDVTGNGKNVVRASFGIYFDEALQANQFQIGIQQQPTLNNQNATYSDTAVGSGTMASLIYGTSAIPAGPPPNETNFFPGANSSLYWWNPSVTDPRSYQTHVGYTRQLTSSTVFSADYTYVLGEHEFRAEESNPTESATWDPNYASYNTCGIAASSSYRRNECAFRAAGFAAGTIGSVKISTTDNATKYNEMTLHFEQRARRVTLQATYTLAYAYGYGGTVNGVTGSGGATAADVPFQWNTPSEWGPALTDARHRVVLSSVINLPWGISASPIFQINSAQPYNCLAGTAWTGSGQTTDRCWMVNGQLVAPTLPYTQGLTEQVSSNYLRGTATWDLDARVQKSVSIRERLKANFFAEFYNITDKANFGNNYQATFTSTTFRQPAGYYNNGQSYPTSRQVQLGARFTF